MYLIVFLKNKKINLMYLIMYTLLFGGTLFMRMRVLLAHRASR